MKFKRSLMRNLSAAGLAAALLAACGGATQVDSFEPKRIIAFGDEYSVIDDSSSANNGRKYTINGITYGSDGTTPTVPTTYDCNANPVWNQKLAASFGMVFNECRPATITATQPSRIKAVAGARVADIAAQIKSFTDSESFDSKDLSTLLIGTQDILDLYDSSLADPTLSVEVLVASAGVLGTAAGAEVVKLTDLGTKVIVSTLPNLGSSPFAAAEDVARPGQGRSDLLTRMTTEFNTRLRLKLEDVRNGGRSVGLVLADDMVRSLLAFPSGYGLSNTAGIACVANSVPVADLRECNMLTLVTGATATNYLWADDTHVGPNAQSRIGDLAVTRAHNNPF